MHETSAGGLVIDGLDGPKDTQVAALIGRIDRRGRMLWSLPKGHIEVGETAEQGRLDETFVDALCEPPVVMTYGGMIAHVLTFAAHRRTLVAGALVDAGITDLGAGDPLYWVADAS